MTRRISVYKKNIALIVILMFFLFSCRENKKYNDNGVSLKPVIDNVLGDKLEIPDSLNVYTPFLKYVSDSVQISDSNFKIYTYINASCSTCIEDISKWREITDEFVKNGAVVCLIFHSDDNYEFIKYLCESGAIRDFPFPFFFDAKDEYLKKNSFVKHSKHFETVLTDRENHIILMGNPLLSEDIKKHYISEIQLRKKL